MKNRMQRSALGGQVLSPFGDMGDFDIGGLINTIGTLGGKIADTVNTAIKAGQQPATVYTPPSAQPVVQQQPSYQAPAADNAMLYVAGGVAALILVLALSRR